MCFYLKKLRRSHHNQFYSIEHNFCKKVSRQGNQSQILNDEFYLYFTFPLKIQKFVILWITFTKSTNLNTQENSSSLKRIEKSKSPWEFIFENPCEGWDFLLKPTWMQALRRIFIYNFSQQCHKYKSEGKSIQQDAKIHKVYTMSKLLVYL